MKRIYALAGGDLPIVKIRDGLTDAKACELEIALVAAIGRERCGGPLVNMTDGGEGTKGYREPKSLEHRRKIGLAHMGHAVSAETRAKIARSNKGKIFSPEVIERRAAKIRGRLRGPPSSETRAKIGAGNRGRKATVATRALMSAASAGKPKSQEHAAKIVANLMRWRATDEGRGKLSTAAYARWGDPAFKRKVADSIKRYHAQMTDEERAARSKRISEATKARMADHAVRTKISAGMRSGART